MKSSCIDRLTLLACALLIAFATPLFAKQNVKLAFIGPLTGGNAAIGLGGRNSAQLAVKIHNADPKAKYHYQLVVYDGACKPNVAVRVATKAGADRNIIAGITNYCSTATLAAVPIYHKFRFPVVVWGAVLPAITYGNDFPEIHRVDGTMINQNEVNAKFITDQGYKTFAIIHDTTAYGKGHDKYFTKYITQDGGKILADFGVGPDQQDLTAILTKIKGLHPQVIFFGGLTPVGVRIRSQMEKLGLKAQFDGTTGILNSSYITALGSSLAEGSLAIGGGAPLKDLPGGKFFLKKYKTQHYKNPPQAYGPFAFAATNLVMHAIEQVGPNRAKVTAELSKTKNYKSILGPITFDSHGQNSVPVMTVYVVQNGQWVPWKHSEYATGKRQLASQK
jgi:branched-chain amino acid transport system substrate-binding protein